MKNQSKKQLEECKKTIENILNSEKADIRLGDADTPLSFDKIIEDLDTRTVSIEWSDGKITTATAHSDDEYDFEVGLSICVTKKLANLNEFAKKIRTTKRFESKKK